MEWRVKDCMRESIYLTWFSIDRMDSPELSDSSSSLIGRSRVFQSPEMASLTSLVKSTKPRNSSAKWGQSLYTAGNLSPLKLIETNMPLARAHCWLSRFESLLIIYLANYFGFDQISKLKNSCMQFFWLHTWNDSSGNRFGQFTLYRYILKWFLPWKSKLMKL